MRFLVLFLAIFGAISMPAPLAAQLAPGISGVSGGPIDASEEEYWFFVRQVGECLATYKTEEAKAFLSAEIDSRAEKRAFDSLFNRKRNMCMRNFVRVSLVRAHLRGSVAEGLYRRNMREWSSTTQPVSSRPETIASIHDFAKCYVATEFASTQSLLSETRLATDGELERVSELVESFAPCLPDRKVTLRSHHIRLALAEAMYHATKHADPQGRS